MRPPSAARRSGALLRRFSADSRGNIVVMGAVLMIPLTLLAGGASDYARARQVKSELQDALDAAVLGGVRAADPVVAAAAQFEPPVSAGVSVATPVFEPPTPAGIFTGSVSAQVPAAFLGMAGISHFTVGVSASAGLKRMPTDVCLTALRTSGPGLHRQGSGDIHATGCRFEILSTASPAADFGSNGGQVTASDICVRGATVSGNAPTSVRRNCTIERPARLTPPPAPIVGACTASNTNLSLSNETTRTLYGGTYCGTIRLNGIGAYTLQPGAVFILRGASPGVPGQVIYEGSGSLTGQGVHIYFADSTQLVLGNNSANTGKVVLTAPTSGRYQGVLMSEAGGLAASTLDFKRSSGAFMKGVIHLPSRNITVGGSGSATMDELTLKVRSVSTYGSGTYTFKPAPLSVAHAGEPVLKD